MPEVHWRKTPATNDIVPTTATDRFPVDMGVGGSANSANNPMFTQQVGSQAATYGVEIGGITPYATPTDLLGIFGSASKIIRVTGMRLNAKSTAAGVLSSGMLWQRRSAASTGGAFTAMAGVPYDTTSAAPTATAGYWTAAPTPGASLGNLRYTNTVTTVVIGTGGPNGLSTAGYQTYSTMSFGTPIVLRGIAEGLVITFSGATLPAGYVADFGFEWTET